MEQAEQEFVFDDVHAKPVPSLLRNFSAPVKMTVLGQTEEDLAHMLAHDTDPFNRWESCLTGRLTRREIPCPQAYQGGLPAHQVGELAAACKSSSSTAVRAAGVS